MNDLQQFKEERKENVKRLGSDEKLKACAKQFTIDSLLAKYSYNFDWLGVPIIQHPQDIIAMQEIIWRLKPDLIIETGIARGGSVIFYGSMVELCGKGEVLAIDIDIRAHNREVIEAHPMYKNITMIEGSSVDEEVVRQVRKKAAGKETVLITLDSSHAHDHVLAELRAYAPLVTKGSYLVVFDTVAEDLPEGSIKNRPWDKGSNPKTALDEFMKENQDFGSPTHSIGGGGNYHLSRSVTFLTILSLYLAVKTTE